MLTWLKIKNLALVEDAEIEFSSGLNIISGETGTGKSVIIGAVSLLLGKRSDKSIIRKGKNRCELSAGVLFSPGLKKYLIPVLEHHSIPLVDNEFLLRRVITPNSSRNYINDTNVTLSVLAQLGEYLVDFHGPNHNLSLLKPSTQLELIDRFGSLENLRQKCIKFYNEVKKSEKELEELQSQLPDAIEAEYLRRMIIEVEKISPLINEDLELSAKHKIAANAKDILSLTSNAKFLLYDAEDSLLNRFASLNRDLEDLAKIDSGNADKFTSRIDTITDEIKELAFELETYASETELDEYELARLEDRLNEVTTLKRKYGPTIKNVLETLNKAKERLNKMDNFEGIKNEIEKNLQQLNLAYNSNASNLSKERKGIADTFSEATKIKLNKLGFLKADISVDFQSSSPSPSGIDKIEFLFTANPGEIKQPLRKVASSGEISRIMLAVKTVLTNADNIPVLIFDEIDANIGGEVANQVGMELQNLGKKHHVLCISHQPQVAAFANAHYNVSKTVGDDSRTFTKISKLNDDERVMEIARMLGGGKAAYEHAKKIIASHK
jgi:DNA repair protein RecN (Recombination protein N)